MLLRDKVRRGHKLAGRLPHPPPNETQSLAVGKFMLKNRREVRKPQIENRRRVKCVSVAEDSRVSIKSRAPTVDTFDALIGVAVCLPIGIPANKSFFSEIR